MAKRYSLGANRVGNGAETLLGELELEIMQIIWARQRVTVREVLEALSEKWSLAYTIVMTVMTRLVDKDILRQHRQDRTHATALPLPRNRRHVCITRRSVAGAARGGAYLAPASSRIFYRQSSFRVGDWPSRAIRLRGVYWLMLCYAGP